MIAVRDADGRPYSDAVILGNAMTMLLAGEDTTAYTLAWAVHELCDAPDVAAKLRDEADALLREGIARDIETANQLAYAGAVANETMRLRPVAPVLLFEALRDVVIGDVAAPKGIWVAVLTRSPAVDDRHFAEPATFRRALAWRGAARTGLHDPSAYPIWIGAENLPGRTLALLEMKSCCRCCSARSTSRRVGDAAAVGTLPSRCIGRHAGAVAPATI
jgi:hypothetical protein